MSVRVAASATRGAVNESLAFELRGTGQEGELRLNSPFGNRLATARWTPGVVELTSASASGVQRFDSLDALSEQMLGEALPLKALPDWLAGRPWAGAPHTDLPAPASGFDQLGWQVLLGRRAEGWIEAARSSAPAALLRIRLEAAP
jgi:outer membrane lipoprotein LolB